MRQTEEIGVTGGLRQRVVKFIVNPASGNGKTRKALPDLIAIAKKLGAKFDLQLTEAPEHAIELARDSSNQFDAVVAVGGDGTVNEVAAGALKSNKTMGVIPTGTGNDFARALGKLKNLHEYVHRILNGQVRSIDTGTLHLDGREFIFVNGVGIGFDAEVAKESLNVRWLGGISRYLFAVMKTLAKYRSSSMKIELDERTMEQKTFLIAIGNGISAGGGFLLTPHASLDDGVFDACIVSDVSISKVMQVLPRVLNGTHERHKEVFMTKTRQLIIRSESPVAVHRDGEVYSSRVQDISVRIVPASLRVIT